MNLFFKDKPNAIHMNIKFLYRELWFNPKIPTRHEKIAGKNAFIERFS